MTVGVTQLTGLLGNVPLSYRPEGAPDHSQGQRPWNPMRGPKFLSSHVLRPPPRRPKGGGAAGGETLGGGSMHSPGALPLAMVRCPFGAVRQGNGASTA